MHQPQFPCRVGDVVIAGTFRVSPETLADHFRSQSEAAVLASPGTLPGALRGVVSSSELPVELLVAAALPRLASAGLLRGHAARITHVGRARILSRPVLGEPVTVVGTVRYRSVRGGIAHLTFSVELRRAHGEIATRFEVGVDLHPRLSAGIDERVRAA